MINEFIANPTPDLDPAGREWIELKNTTSTEADILRVAPQRRYQRPSELGTFEGTTIIPAGGYR